MIKVFLFTILVIAMNGIVAAEEEYIKVVLANATYDIEIIENTELKPGSNVKSMATKYQIIINGGYYNEEKNPAGYLKISKKEINANINKKLSGAVVCNNEGNIEIVTTNDLKTEKWDNILQSGPFLIDPGGKMGIKIDDGKIANRTCIGKYKNGDIIIIHSTKNTLYKLAKLVLDKEKEIDSLLNLDGGPMAGIWCINDNKKQVNNTSPAINYIGIRYKKSE